MYSLNMLFFFSRINQSLSYYRTWEVHKDFDFVMKCDDDTYVVVDNLKHRLDSMDPR